MNKRKTKELRKVFEQYNVGDKISFKKYKKIYTSNTQSGNKSLKILKGRENGMA